MTMRASVRICGVPPITAASSWLPQTAAAPASTISRTWSTTQAGSAP
jgi:hypothetical protein